MRLVDRVLHLLAEGAGMSVLNLVPDPDPQDSADYLRRLIPKTVVICGLTSPIVKDLKDKLARAEHAAAAQRKSAYDQLPSDCEPS